MEYTQPASNLKVLFFVVFFSVVFSFCRANYYNNEAVRGKGVSRTDSRAQKNKLKKKSKSIIREGGKIPFFAKKILLFQEIVFFLGTICPPGGGAPRPLNTPMRRGATISVENVCSEEKGRVSIF